MRAEVPGLGVGEPHTLHPQDEGQLRLAPRVRTAPGRAPDASTLDEDTDTDTDRGLAPAQSPCAAGFVLMLVALPLAHGTRSPPGAPMCW